MSTQNNLRRDREVSQDINLAESQNKHKNPLASAEDYYFEWTPENKSIEKPKSEKAGNLAEVQSDKVYPHRTIANKQKRSSWNYDANVSASYNEIYNRAELYNFP